MKWFLPGLMITMFPCWLIAQKGSYVGLQATPLAIGTIDLLAEERLSNTASLVVGTGFRTQRLDRREPRVRLLSDFSNQTNTAAYFSGAIRLFNPETGVDYPYVQFGLTGLWYRDRYLSQQGEHVSEGFNWGAFTVIGYLININQRWQVDLGLQMGYSPPREDLLAYYYPGMGYSTFGLGRYGVIGGHVQPMVAVKYKIRLSEREKLHLGY